LRVYRVDEVYRPGIILQDIITGIAESEVIVAEITPPNANVFYELGYAHALSKPTILLAERGKELPFDIKSYRCIFYDNTIRGKKEVELNLRRHLASILQEP
jgi:nucleoside 2-deoxyribosyltransferase